MDPMSSELVCGRPMAFLPAGSERVAISIPVGPQIDEYRKGALDVVGDGAGDDVEVIETEARDGDKGDEASLAPMDAQVSDAITEAHIEEARRPHIPVDPGRLTQKEVDAHDVIHYISGHGAFTA